MKRGIDKRTMSCKKCKHYKKANFERNIKSWCNSFNISVSSTANAKVCSNYKEK